MAETSSLARRAELAAFLRSRRDRVTPEEYGLAPGPRRRTPGLRREELAQLAGVGVTWYTWLEQGRPINVSVQILDAIAGVLHLGASERWHLYRLAEVPGVPTVAEVETLPVEVLRVLDALDPSPACVYDGKFDLLACNAPFAALFPTMVEADGIERNALWNLFAGRTPSPITDRQVCAAMVATVRSNYGHHLGDPRWTRFIEQLCAASEEFATLWQGYDVAGAPAPVTKAFECFGLGTIRVRTTGFPVAGTVDMRMVVYLPESPADAALLETLRERRSEQTAAS